MGNLARARWFTACVLWVLTGCAENSMVLKGQLDKFRDEQTALSKQREELQNRATRLDRDNQDLITQLTQTKQRTKVLEDQIALMRDQLNASNTQLARLRDEKQTTEQKVQALTASLQRQGGTPITPNNSLLQTVPAINLPDVYARRDGDVIRVELPSHRLFETGNARLLPLAPSLILAAATEVMRAYPNQVIGVEGHTDSDPLTNPQWQNPHQLSLGRALAVYDVLVNQARVPPSQLVVVGHGANHPILSGATPTGKQRNARVEIVVYPETAGSRQQP